MLYAVIKYFDILLVFTSGMILDACYLYSKKKLNTSETK